MNIFKKERKPDQTDLFLHATEELFHGVTNEIASKIGDSVERCLACKQLYRVSQGCICGVSIVDSTIEES